MKKKILLIDDDPIVLKSLIALLQNKDYEVTGCSSGYEALEAFKNKRYNLVISDIRMPELDGTATIKKIRDLETNLEIPITPVIMITGYASEDKPIAAIKLGVRDYILKPFDLTEFIESVDKCFEGAEEIEETEDLFSKCREYSRADLLKLKGNFPYFREVEQINDRRVNIEGQPRIMLAGNNYLGAANDNALKETIKTVVDKFGVGSTGSRLVSGNFILYKEFEMELSNFFDREDAVIFNTGYHMNVGTISCLVGRHEYLVLDSEAHASIVDGAYMSFGTVKRFRHNDMEDLERIFSDLPRGKILTALDGVYSMEGDLANLPRIVELCKKYGSRIYVDEAHSFGVFGKKGRGIAEHFGLDKEIDLIAATFGKSCGAMGGVVTGKREIINFIRYNARSILFSTGLPASIVSAAKVAFESFILSNSRKEILWRNTNRIRAGLKKFGFYLGRSESPIIPIILGDPDLTLKFWKKLFDQGIFVGAMIPPAVPPNKSLLRMSCTAQLSIEDINFVLTKCEEIMNELDVKSIIATS